MPGLDFERRLTVLEQEFQMLKGLLVPATTSKTWRDTFGTFADDPGFDEILKLGQEIRERERGGRRMIVLDTDHLGEFQKGTSEAAQRLHRRLANASETVATTIVSIDAMLLSANLRDFERVPELHVEDWLHTA